MSLLSEAHALADEIKQLIDEIKAKGASVPAEVRDSIPRLERVRYEVLRRIRLQDTNILKGEKDE